MTIRTFTHLYDNYEDAVQIVHALEGAGVPHSDISLIGKEHGGSTAVAGGSGTGTAGTSTDTNAESTGAGTGASIGTLLGGGAGLLAGIGSLAIPGVGPVIAAGWLVATLAGAGVGAAGGGLLGSLVGAGVPENHAHTYAEGVRRGSTLVTVRADDSHAAAIEAILAGRTPVDITARTADYRQSGWERFNPDGAALTDEELQAERGRRGQIS